ncbi:hypothetical protein DITRI_Ditri06bG0077800 [Diplodiscus trichospermus]
MIWHNRNKCLFDQLCKTPNGLSRAVASLSSDYATFNHSVEGNTSGSVTRWVPPEDGWLKINVDPAYYLHSEEASIAFVVRDSNEIVHKCGSKKVTRVGSCLHAELLAVLFGVEEVVDRHHPNIIFENDSQNAINEIKQGEASLSEWGSLVFDICSLYIEKRGEP